ncbi:uncharacterized protein LOC143883406 [Tasmannia lanceolata]|uniref:uncharacterized protein LOC143883406 n=1 Tax=Tasmannia lanceolata TaxID=3420 RepID=UPI0040636DA9
MVMISGSSETETQPRFMTPSKSHRLHNFSMPILKWGNQKHLRCMKLNSNGQINAPDLRSSVSEAESDGGKGSDSENRSFKNRFSSYPFPSRNFGKFRPPPIRASGKSKTEKETDDGIEEIRAKLLVHLRTAAKKMKFPVPESGEEEESEARPWNLRTRRAACKAPNEIGGNSKEILPKKELSPLPEILLKSQRLRSMAAEKKERRKFSVSLSRDEIEEDFFSMAGSRPSRRPKKRAKIIQRQLDACFPGLWLTEITPDSYKVADFQEPRKR